MKDTEAERRRPAAARRVAARLAGALATVAVAACGAGAPIGAPAALDSPAGAGSGEPNLAVGPDGTLWLSWLEPTVDGGHALRLSARRDGDWSGPTTVASGDDFFVNWADFPSVVALDDGSLVAHWLVTTGRGAQYDIHIARSRDRGASWSPAVVPHRDGTASEHGFVSLFPGANGQVAAVWLDGRNYAEAGADDHDPSAEMTLRLTSVGPEGTLGRELLLDDRTCDCCQTAAAMTDAGPVIAYRDRSPDEVRDIAIVRFVDGRWTEPRPLHEDGWVIRACPVNGPAIAAAGTRVAVAWFTAAADTPRVRLAFSDDAGATFGPPVEISGGVAGGTPAGRVDVELLDDGTAVVSWIERTAESAEIRVRAVEPDGVPAPPIAVAAASAARASGFPRLAIAGDELVVAWTEPGGAGPSRVRLATATIRR